MPKVEIPGTDTEVDPTDPVGTASSFAMLAVGVAMAIAAFSVGQYLYNQVADAAPSVDDEIEVL